MKGLKYGSLLAASLFCAPPLDAATVKVGRGEDGKERVILENDLLHVQVDPNRGARVDGFQFKPWGAVEILRHSDQHGLLMDHFWQEPWPGQFWEATYDYRIVSRGPAGASVTFSCLSKGISQVAGIRLENTITLRENDRTVRVLIRLTNTTSEGKYIGYWLQNICWLGGDKGGDHYFRPSIRGISRTSSDERRPPDRGFVREPQAGWIAAVDAKTRTGLVWFMDYNHLWFLYNCTGASTIEWQDDAVILPAGKTWQTQVAMVPVSKLEAVSYASGKLLVGVSFKEDKAAGRLHVTQTYIVPAKPLKSLSVRTGLETLMTHRKQESAAQSMAGLGFQPRTIAVSFPYDTVKREPAVVRLSFSGQTAAGQAFSEEAELWYPGSRTANVDTMYATPIYTIKGPKKVKTLIKPDRIARIVKDRPQVLFLKGFLSRHYRLEPAMKKVGPGVQIKEGFAYHSFWGWFFDFFPYGYETLMTYDLVILGDVSAPCLGEAGLEMLKDYCHNGGNLLVLGGPMAYGSGGYRTTVLDQMLPVASQKSFDLRPVAKGAVTASFPPGTVSAAAAETLRPEYVHQVKAKPGADVLMTCGPWPMIVLGKYGSGKVCCVTAPPMGQSSYCDSPQWQDVLAYLFTHLGVKR